MIGEILTFLVIAGIYAWLKGEEKPKSDDEIAEEIFKKYKL